MQQLLHTGINVVLFYTAPIFETAGFDKSQSDMAALLIAFIQFIFTIVATVLMDKAGRKVIDIVFVYFHCGLWQLFWTNLPSEIIIAQILMKNCMKLICGFKYSISISIFVNETVFTAVSGTRHVCILCLHWSISWCWFHQLRCFYNYLRYVSGEA